MNNGEVKSEIRSIQGLFSWVLYVSPGMDIEGGIEE